MLLARSGRASALLVLLLSSGLFCCDLVSALLLHLLQLAFLAHLEELELKKREKKKFVVHF
jgi:hypothetical protein